MYLAHEVYVLPQNIIDEVYNQKINIFSSLSDPFNLSVFIALSITITIALICFFFIRYTRYIHTPISYLEKLDFLSLFIPRLCLSYVFFVAYFTNSVFGPEIAVGQIIPSIVVSPLLLAIAIFLIFRPSMAAYLGAFLFGLVFAAKGHYTLTYAHYLSIFAAIVLARFFPAVRSKQSQLAIMRIGLGTALLYTAFQIKVFHPGLSYATVTYHHLTNYFPFDPTYIVFGAFMVEAGLAISLILGFYTRLTSAVVLGFVFSSLMYFTGESIWPHLIAIGIAIALVISGSKNYSLDNRMSNYYRKKYLFKGKPHTRTVVLGGGFAGVSCALKLSDLLGDQAEITLVDRNEYHLFTPALYEAATNEQSAQGVAIPFATIFEDRPVSLKIAQVSAIKPSINQIKLISGELVSYDYLVIALGSQTAYFGVPGAQQFSMPLKTLEDALNIKTAIRALFEKAGNGKNPATFEIIIGGGGFTGTELAGELYNYIRILTREFNMPRGIVNLSIVQSGAVLLADLDQSTGKIAQNRLEKLGIKVITGSHITSVVEHAITLTDNSALLYDVLIWTTGVEAVSLLKESEFESTDKRGRIDVTPTLQTTKFDNVFVCGDCSAFPIGTATTQDPHSATSAKAGFAPAVAQVAINQGKTAALNIFSLVTAQPLRGYRYHHTGYVVPVYGRFSLARLSFLRIDGFVGYLIQQAIVLKWFSEIMPLTTALMRWDTFEMQLATRE